MELKMVHEKDMSKEEKLKMNYKNILNIWWRKLEKK